MKWVQLLLILGKIDFNKNLIRNKYIVIEISIHWEERITNVYALTKQPQPT